MKKQLDDLARQRLALFEKIEGQRREMAEISRSLQKPLELANIGLTVARFIYNHPGWVSGGFAAVMSLRGMGVTGFAQKGWRLLYLYPAAFTFGMKYLFSAIRTKDLFSGHTGKSNTDGDQ